MTARRRVPAVPRLAALLESRRMAHNPLAVFAQHAARHGHDYIYHFAGIRRVRVTCNPAVLRRILKDNNVNYRKSPIQMRRMQEFLGPGLLTHHGEAWRQRRLLVQRGFSPAALAALTPGMQDALDEAMAGFDAAVAAGPIDLGHAMMGITFGMVARSLFGARMPPCEVEAISDAILRIQAFIVRRITQPHLAAWFMASGAVARHQALRRQGDAIIARRVAERRAAPTPAGADMLQLLLDATDPETGQRLSDADVTAECMQLLVAGHETSSTALAWTLDLLARHPAQLAAARAELDAVLGDGRAGHRHLGSLPRCTRILEEALRLYPPFWMVDRVAIADDEADGMSIPAGETIIAFLHGAHHAPDWWEDPERFAPERIGEADRRTARGFTYLPFGGGPRACVGSSYAMLQMLMVLDAVLRRYEPGAGGAQAAPMMILRQRAGACARIRRIAAAVSP